MKFTATLRFGKWMHAITIQSMVIPKYPTEGLSSRIPHTKDFVIFLDYDNIKDETLKQELGDLQDVFGLGDFQVLTTNEYGRHSICVDRLVLREALEVVYASTCDPVFKRGIRFNEYRTWILRTEPKGNRAPPKYLFTVESEHNGERLQSEAHANFLHQHFGVPVRLTNPDGNLYLELQKYKTSHVDVKR